MQYLYYTVDVKEIKKLAPDYLSALGERIKKSRVTKPYQLTGLYLASILEDNRHKSLYMRLAKKYDNQRLLEIAKNVAERKAVTNKGAYFMKVWFKK